MTTDQLLALAHAAIAPMKARKPKPFQFDAGPAWPAFAYVVEGESGNRFVCVVGNSYDYGGDVSRLSGYWHSVSPCPAKLDTSVRCDQGKNMRHEVSVTVVAQSILTYEYMVEFGPRRRLYIVDGSRVMFARYRQARALVVEPVGVGRRVSEGGVRASR